jgi:hypothetical protein
MASRTARSVDRTVDKMLKQMAQTRPSAGSAGSASSAAQAIERMAEIQKRIARGEMEAAQFLTDQAIKQAEAEESPEMRREKLRALQAEKEKAAGPKNTILAAIAGVAVVVLAGGALAFSSIGSGHSVAGTITLDQKPLPMVEVVFQPKSGGGEPTRTTTSDRGTFRIRSLPRGEYAIFLASSDSGKLPKKYLSPDSTPFALRLTYDRRDLRMMATSGSKTN